MLWLEPKLSLLRDILLIQHLEAWKRRSLQTRKLLFADRIWTQQFSLFPRPALCVADAVDLCFRRDKRKRDVPPAVLRQDVTAEIKFAQAMRDDENTTGLFGSLAATLRDRRMCC